MTQPTSSGIQSSWLLVAKFIIFLLITGVLAARADAPYIDPAEDEAHFGPPGEDLFWTTAQKVAGFAIRSPVSGIVGDLHVDQKAAVSVDTPIMAVVDLSRFEIDAQIPESYADDLAVGIIESATTAAQPGTQCH